MIEIAKLPYMPLDADNTRNYIVVQGTVFPHTVNTVYSNPNCHIVLLLRRPFTTVCAVLLDLSHTKCCLNASVEYMYGHPHPLLCKFAFELRHSRNGGSRIVCAI